mmetsp:Transcript_795/g.1884  ORF Transcript_795/g.1884 Transcript_795/m.1884 type:complete len:204 (+) Transcript_795:1370-1981(+)
MEVFSTKRLRRLRPGIWTGVTGAAVISRNRCACASTRSLCFCSRSSRKRLRRRRAASCSKNSSSSSTSPTKSSAVPTTRSFSLAGSRFFDNFRDEGLGVCALETAFPSVDLVRLEDGSCVLGSGFLVRLGKAGFDGSFFFSREFLAAPFGLEGPADLTILEPVCLVTLGLDVDELPKNALAVVRLRNCVLFGSVEEGGSTFGD